jgi:hypothetical protein
MLVHAARDTLTKGSSGLGSVSSEQIDSSTCTQIQTGADVRSLWGHSGLGKQAACIHCQPAGQGTFDTVSAGLHCSLRMSRQMLPLLLMLGWYTFVEKLTCKG